MWTPERIVRELGEPLLLQEGQARHLHTLSPDTREIQQASDPSGCVFVALRGARFDGHRALTQVPAGMHIVEQEVSPPEGSWVLRVESTRRALALLAAAWEDHPSRRLPVMGLTGTNGKTTTAAMMEAALQSLSPGVIGTTGARWSLEQRALSLTTPQPRQWQRLLREMADGGCGLVLAEVSSIGLDARRVDGTRFEGGVFTNLSRDHLDYHRDMDDYARAKSILFEELVRPGGIAVYNAQDPWAERILGTRSDLQRWSFGRPQDEVYLERLSYEAKHSVIRAHTPMGKGEGLLRMVGDFNLLNASAAIASGLALGVELQTLLEGLASLSGVRGRLESVPGPEDQPSVFVDYAHTPAALSLALEALRPHTAGQLWVVFGCGGDRDRGKREWMAKAAARAADRLVATSDNPRHEDPAAILGDLKPHLDSSAWLIADRAEAIRRAIESAGPQDCVLIAGKGHETYQEIAGVRHPFDDHAQALRALEET